MQFGRFKKLSANRKTVVLILKMKVRDKQLKAQLARHREREQAEYVHHLQTPFERVWVPAICNQVYAAFSREVRDIVYSELHAEDHSHPMDSFYLSSLNQRFLLRKLNGPVGYPSPYLSPSDRRSVLSEHHLSPHGRDVYSRAYFNKNIVGAAIAKEIVEAWYKRATFADDSRDCMLYHDYLRVDRWGLGLRPAHLLRHITLELEEEDVRNFRRSALSSSGLGALREIRGLRDLHIKIRAGSDLDMKCLVCGKDKSLCKGNFENFLSREDPEHWRMDKRFLGITSILPKITKANPRLLVTYHHTNQKYPPITLHKTGEKLEARGWYDILLEYSLVRMPVYQLVHIELTQHTGSN